MKSGQKFLKMFHGLVLFTIILFGLVSIAGTGGKDAGDCDSDQWECDNGECIPVEWHCDGSVDCDDESDEWACDD